ncbi:MAG: LysR substrate-binding domain-containing protein [Polyangiaceae bacterium]
MNLNQLRVFHVVASEGSVTAAARRLRVSQPAVSKQLKELEQTLGAALFDRVARGVTLTQVGELVLSHSSRIFAQEQSLESELAALLGLASGRLSVGASTTIGNYLVPGLFGQFRRLHPGVDLELEIANTEAVQAMVLDNRVDIGLTEGFVSSSALLVSVFSEDEIVMVTAPGDPMSGRAPLDPLELDRVPLICREQGSGTRAVIEAAFRERGIALEPSMSLGSNEAIKQAVAAGLGVAMMSRLAVQAELESGRLTELPLKGEAIRRRLHAVRLEGKHATPALGAFLTLLSEPRGRRLRAHYAI